MTWLKKVLGGRSASEWLEQAEREQRAGDLGHAKLAFDRAFERAKDDEALRTRAVRGADACCDALARERLAQAQGLVAQGNLELARDELMSALDTARGADALAEVRAALHAMEGHDALEAATETPAPLSPEERLTLIASNWEPLQAEELEGYGEPLAAAVVDLDEGRGQAALAKLLKVVETASAPRYLWLEVGRAHLSAEDPDRACEALRRFLSSIGPEEGGAARLMAHSALAHVAHERGDTEAAVAELEACAEALEDDPRPYLQLGGYLRLAKRPGEAVEVLEMCGQMFPGGQAEWPVTMELGLALSEADNPTRAIVMLETVVESFAERGETAALPPPMVTILAGLHEAAGNLTRAADLYRMLAEGHHREAHAQYHREAARLLEGLGATEEAERMRQRAEAIGG